MNSPLQGKRVLITGAARGIGEHTARLLAAQGARVALVGLEPQLLKKVASETNGIWAEADVTDQSSLDQAVRQAVEAFGGIDVVVANAGISNIGTVALGPIEPFIRTVEVNLVGVMRTVAATLPHIVAAKGYVLLVSSAAAFSAMPGMAAYCASKAGVEQFGNVLRLEVMHLGVNVGTVHPVWIDTDLVRDIKETLPAFQIALKKLPWPLNTYTSVEKCAAALVKAIKKRQRRVYVPRSIAMVQALRTVIISSLSDRIVYLATNRGKTIVEMEDQVRAHGSSFGRHSAG